MLSLTRKDYAKMAGLLPIGVDFFCSRSEYVFLLYTDSQVTTGPVGVEYSRQILDDSGDNERGTLSAVWHRWDESGGPPNANRIVLGKRKRKFAN
jgi:hypothetical protein